MIKKLEFWTTFTCQVVKFRFYTNSHSYINIFLLSSVFFCSKTHLKELKDFFQCSCTIQQSFYLKLNFKLKFNLKCVFLKTWKKFSKKIWQHCKFNAHREDCFLTIRKPCIQLFPTILRIKKQSYCFYFNF